MDKLINKVVNGILRSKTVKNGVWLYVLQIFNTLIPMITIPYITRILGPSQYGIFSSALNIITYILVIVEYGFNYSGTRKVALAKSKEEISKIYNTITQSKLILFASTIVLMLLIGIVFNVPEGQFYTIIILFLMVLGTALQQNWVFQGLEDMKFITITSVISRTISVILIFLLVKEPSHVYIYAGLHALTFLLIGIISTLIVRFKYRISFQKVSVKNITSELKDGWTLFTTSAMSQVFGGIGVTVLIFTSTEAIVGIYAAIQNVPIVMKTMFTPISQILYPKMSKYFEKSYKLGIRTVKRSVIYIMPFFIGISLILILNTKSVVSILFGKDYVSYSYILIPLLIWMLFSILNNFLGLQTLVASGYQKEYSQSFSIGVIAMIVLNIMLGSLIGMFGVALAAVLAEFCLTLAILFKIKKVYEMKIENDKKVAK